MTCPRCGNSRPEAFDEPGFGVIVACPDCGYVYPKKDDKENGDE
jgi:uncharacterized Zn finger protein